MIIAISLEDTTGDEGLPRMIYTSRVAVFDYEAQAQEFAKDRPEITLVDTDSLQIIKGGMLCVDEED